MPFHISYGKGHTELNKKKYNSAESMFHIKQISCCLFPTYSIPGIAHFELSYLLWPPAGHGHGYK